MNEGPKQALVAATDASLRVGAFDLLASYGFRVDATGDARALGRRLEKDRYDWLITDAEELPPLPASTAIVQITRESLPDRSAWTAQIETRLREAGLSPLESSEES